MTRAGRVGASAALIALVAATASARADGPTAAATTPRFALDAGACPPGVEAEVRRILSVETGPLLLEAGQPVPADGDHVRVICREKDATIEARGAGEGDPVTRTLRLDAFPGDAAPRAVALAAIEALAALNRQRAQAAQAGPARVTTADAPSTLAQATAPAYRPPPASIAISLSLVRRVFVVSHGLSLWSGAVDIQRNVGSRWAVGLNLELGAVDDTSAGSLGHAHGIVTSAAAFFGPRYDRTPLSGALAVGGRLGVASLSGSPSLAATGTTVVRPWSGPALAAYGVLGKKRVQLRVNLEIGVALLGTEGLAGGASVLSISGGWIALSVGPGVRG
jgi:hypothetical protein